MKHNIPEDHSKPPKHPDLSPRGPYATVEDRHTARECGITVRQLRQDRANDDVILPDNIKSVNKTANQIKKRGFQ